MIQEGEMRNPDGTSSRPIGQTRTRGSFICIFYLCLHVNIYVVVTMF